MDLIDFFSLAINAIISGQHDLFEVVNLSLFVSFSAVVIASLIGIPLGGFLATTRFKGRSFVIVLVNALMGLPPVVVGLMIYLLLSR